jgi:glycine dehydrogenase
LAKKNNPLCSFLGDGLKDYQVPEIVGKVCALRGLTTAYTPYQPERSQGTLWTLWLYSSSLSMLTGFEAINASLYDRSTALHESLNTALRIHRKAKRVLVAETLYPGDLEVLTTLSEETPLEITTVPVDAQTGTVDLEKLKELIAEYKNELAALAFPQVNNLGNLEPVHELTDLGRAHGLQVIGVIDPMLLATGGLTPPSVWGSDKQGCHMIVGEAQHLALGAQLRWPWSRPFGIRYNDNNKTAIRSTPGRYVGKTVDQKRANQSVHDSLHPRAAYSP